MKYDVTELTREGKRNLLRMLCDELTHDQISKLVDVYAQRVEADEFGEPFIVLKEKECELGKDHKLWIDINDVVTETVESDD